MYGSSSQDREWVGILSMFKNISIGVITKNGWTKDHHMIGHNLSWSEGHFKLLLCCYWLWNLVANGTVKNQLKKGKNGENLKKKIWISIYLKNFKNVILKERNLDNIYTWKLILISSFNVTK